MTSKAFGNVFRDRTFAIATLLASCSFVSQPALARSFVYCSGYANTETGQVVTFTSVFAFDGKCGASDNLSNCPSLTSSFYKAVATSSDDTAWSCNSYNTIDEANSKLTDAKKRMADAGIRTALTSWTGNRQLPASTRAAALPSAKSNRPNPTVRYGFCFINILKQNSPDTYNIPNHAYFSNVFQVPAARANSGAITGDTNRLLIRMLKLIQDRYGDGGPNQGGKTQSCKYEKTAEAAESARVGEQRTLKRSQRVRIIETLSTLGLPPA